MNLIENVNEGVLTFPQQSLAIIKTRANVKMKAWKPIAPREGKMAATLKNGLLVISS